jgi:hypothetical protein
MKSWTRCLLTAVTVAAMLSALRSADAQATRPPIARVTDIVVESVTLEGDQLIATANVTLDIAGRTVERTVEIPVLVDGAPAPTGECSILSLAVGPLDLDLLGLVVSLDDCEGGPVTVDITAMPGDGLLGDLLCGIAGLLDGGINLGAVLDSLSTEDRAAFDGAVTSVLNRIFEDVLGAGVATGPMAAQHNAGSARVCNILMLELPEGLQLELLGLLVETSGICLDVHAERGGGNLLGNLLCSLTGLLDNPGNTAGGEAALLRNVNRLLNRLGL